MRLLDGFIEMEKGTYELLISALLYVGRVARYEDVANYASEGIRVGRSIILQTFEERDSKDS
ncbi:MAG: hypothetical protein HFJ35_07180 [Clostridia bacterium]|nr:hypothetical protein [Clostridia bacterium]